MRRSLVHARRIGRNSSYRPKRRHSGCHISVSGLTGPSMFRFTWRFASKCTHSARWACCGTCARRYRPSSVHDIDLRGRGDFYDWATCTWRSFVSRTAIAMSMSTSIAIAIASGRLMALWVSRQRLGGDSHGLLLAPTPVDMGRRSASQSAG